jgi:TatD DNase family protein
MFFDTHAHFDVSQGLGPVADLVERCHQNDVSRMVAIGGNAKLNESALAAAACAPDWVWLALGYDRDQADTFADADQLEQGMATLERLLASVPDECKLAALGEMGLDYHYDAKTAPAQIALFRQQLSLARRYRRPVVVHSREADEDTMTLLSEHVAAIQADPEADQAPGVLHCFTGIQTFAEDLVKLGMFISFSGILTFRNAEALRTVARYLPEHCLVIETDSPYLAPVPMRGKPNEPHYVRHVCALLAEIRGKSTDYMANLTLENGERLFA